MTIKTIRRLDDIKGMRADEGVEVIGINCVSCEGDHCFANVGVVFNIGINRFSLISPVISTTIPPVARISYEWDGESFSPKIDDNQPFQYDSLEYKKYQSLLKQLTSKWAGAI